MKQAITVRVNAFNQTSRNFEERMDGKRINYRDSSDRKWLANSLMWAMCNNVTVTLTPESN